MSNRIEIDDAIVLLLGSPVPGARPGEIRGITRLEKLIFLLERETDSRKWLQEDAKFEPFNFGPFSQRVYQAADLLSAASLIVDSDSPAEDDADTWEQRARIDGGSEAEPTRDPYTTRDFKLTPRGWKYYEALTAELPPGVLAELSSFKKRFAYVPLRQLIRYVYTRYDDFTTKSVIRDEVLGPDR